MATYFIDLDGTVFKLGTNEPLPGAAERLKKLASDRNRIFFVTLRNASQDKLGSAPTKAALASLGVEYDDILWGCPSPRVVVNDEGAYAVNHPQNGAWTNETIP